MSQGHRGPKGPHSEPPDGFCPNPGGTGVHTPKATNGTLERIAEALETQASALSFLAALAAEWMDAPELDPEDAGPLRCEDCDVILLPGGLGQVVCPSCRRCFPEPEKTLDAQ